MSDDSAVIRLIDAVSYQPGAIVSRKLATTPGGNISIFAFDAGEELSEHTTPHTALLHVLDGHAEITIDGVAHRVAAGEVIVLPPGHPHAVRAVERFRMALTMLRA